MSDYRHRGGASLSFRFAASFFAALALEFAPWGEWLLARKPIFPALALVFWCIYHPRLGGYAAAVIVGIATDLAAQTPLGFHAFSYVVMVFAASRLRGRFALLGSAAAAVHVCFILATAQFALYFLGFFDEGLPELTWRRFYPSIVGALLWWALSIIYARGRGR
ncbi:MAG: rod shape-determining protein MreD [Gammaproteobacteria bacterium]